ncbi:acyl-CoA dehydrogenase family protein [Lentzea kentuckyensis]|uniref:acyl-CoA dehydrogenase family protein n=1 Tax=Lentzea kentuckyensis TaxID=360086 RepID=UPI000A398261|nr:acyl-CoA dehydrogenase family protein [Lentzea kentuckyensis]
MTLALGARTEAGEKFVALCEAHADDFRSRAADHDRDGTFPHENFAAMRDSGVLAAPVPAELGGLGVTAVEDLVVGMSRIARGDASTAIALAMHMGPCWSISRNRRRPGADREVLDGYLRLVATGELVLCGAGTEAGTHTRFPLTEASRVDGGWSLTGDKIFATLSPVATAFNIFCRTKQSDGSWVAARAWVTRGSGGFEVVENWDAMGMRASGSHALRLRDCFVPDELMSVRGAWGEWSAEELVHSSAGNLALLSAYLGIAEEARDIIRGTLLKRRKAPSDRLLADRHAIQTLFARIETQLLTCRAVLQRVSRLWDEHLESHVDNDGSLSDAHQLMAEYQCAKAVVEQNAICAVDLAMTASGGAGYLSSNPLARLYRDVRAGPFMQPFSPVELYEYVGKVRLDRDPVVDL